MDACFKSYKNTESKKHLLDAFAMARMLWFVYGALATDRLVTACDKSKFTSDFQRHGRTSIPLKEFISACAAINRN
jgi:hypothetical protein